MYVRLLTPDGSAACGSAVTFRKFRIIIAPASVVYAGGLTGQSLGDYYTVKQSLRLDM